MGLADQAQRKAKTQADEAQKAAQAAQEKWVEETTQWIADRTGYAPSFCGWQDLATGQFLGDDPILSVMSYPTFTIDDVLIAYEKRGGGSLHMVLTSELGTYLGARIRTTLSNKWNKTEKKKRFVEGLAKAMNTAPKHPVEILREHNAACPTCGRTW